MPDLEDRVRGLLDERARDLTMESELPARVRAQARRRRAFAGGAAALGALGLVVALVFAVGTARSHRSGPATDVPTPSVSPVQPTPTPTPTAVDGPYPDTFVGITTEGDLVLTSAGDGSEIVVATAEELSGGRPFDSADIALAPDRSSVWVALHLRGRDSALGSVGELLRVPLDGGTPQPVIQGYRPAVSPDGQKLAFAGCDADGCGMTLVVQDIDGGNRRVLDVSPFSDTWMGESMWLDDGRLAFTLWFPGDSLPSIRVIDPWTEDRQLVDVPELGPSRAGAAWEPIGIDPATGGLILNTYCCGSAAGDEIEERAIIVVDPDTGETTRTLHDGMLLGVKTVDRSGRYLLVHRWTDGGEDLGIFVVEDDGSLRHVADGYSIVAW